VRVLHVVPTYFPAVRYGGPIHSVHGLAAAFARRGHDVHVYTTNVDGRSISNVPLAKPVNLEGVSVWYFPTAIGRRLYRSPQMGEALNRTVASFDLLHIHSVFLWPTTAAARAAQHHRIPYVLAPRGMLVADLIRRKSRFLKLASVTLFERRNLACAAAVHVTSELEASEMAALGLHCRQVVTIPNGVHIPTAQHLLECKSARRKVLFLGRINWKKGLDRLIRALKYLPNVDLLVAGNDEEKYTATLRQLAEGEGVLDRVVFIGRVDGDRKWDLLSKSDLLALPSYSENFGNVVLEAMAAGCPVIVTPEVGLADTVRQSGAGLVVPGTAEELAEAISKIVNDSATAEAMGKAGRNTVVERFSWDAIAAQTEAVYGELLASWVQSGPRPYHVRSFL
jgi:glycosyltransferase involved in cell wall biosynthesis